MARKKSEGAQAGPGARPKGAVVELGLAEVSVDGGTQTRADGTVPAVVEEYADLLRAGVELPPVEVVEEDVMHWLWDGFHRYQAARLAGRDTVRCRITPGTLADARWLALSANKAHGLRRSNADKRRAVELALAIHPEMSDRAIAEHCGVSDPFVGSVRKQVLTVSTLDTRTGKDNKQYPAPPKQDPAAVVAPAPADEYDPFADAVDVADYGEGPPDEGLEPHPADAPGVLRDEVGMEVPERLRDVFAGRARFDELIAELRRVQKRIADLAGAGPGADYRHHLVSKGRADDGVRWTCEHVQNAIYKLKHCKPFASACPHCEHAHAGKVDAACRVCHGAGWVVKSAWEGSPEDYRRLAELRRKAGRS